MAPGHREDAGHSRPAGCPQAASGSGRRRRVAAASPAIPARRNASAGGAQGSHRISTLRRFGAGGGRPRGIGERWRGSLPPGCAASSASSTEDGQLPSAGLCPPSAEPQDLWLVDGVIHAEPVAAAETRNGRLADAGAGRRPLPRRSGEHRRGTDDVAERRRWLRGRGRAAADAGSRRHPLDGRPPGPAADRRGRRRIADPSATCATTPPRWSLTSLSPRSSGRPRGVMAGSNWWGTGSTASSETSPRCGRRRSPRLPSPARTNSAAG